VQFRLLFPEEDNGEFLFVRINAPADPV
jgi:hypothetical protein